MRLLGRDCAIDTPLRMLVVLQGLSVCQKKNHWRQYDMLVVRDIYEQLSRGGVRIIFMHWKRGRVWCFRNNRDANAFHVLLYFTCISGCVIYNPLKIIVKLWNQFCSNLMLTFKRRFFCMLRNMRSKLMRIIYRLRLWLNSKFLFFGTFLNRQTNLVCLVLYL
jgi:hypothetical protein